MFSRTERDLWFLPVLGGGLNYHPFNPAELNRTVRMDILASMIIIPSILENVKWNRKVFRAYYPARTSASRLKIESPLTQVSPTARHLPRSLSLLPCIQSGPLKCCTEEKKIFTETAPPSSEGNPVKTGTSAWGGVPVLRRKGSFRGSSGKKTAAFRSRSMRLPNSFCEALGGGGAYSASFFSSLSMKRIRAISAASPRRGPSL